MVDKKSGEEMVRVGSCNHCGKCCLREGGIMKENVMIELHEDRCKFYVDTLNIQPFGHCLIYGRDNTPIEDVKDRFGNTITKKQIQWFNDNCIGYPFLEDMKEGYLPPVECGFKLEKKIIREVNKREKSIAN